jgi:hypothetical protein
MPTGTQDNENIIERAAALDMGKAELVCWIPRAVPRDRRFERRFHPPDGPVPREPPRYPGQLAAGLGTDLEVTGRLRREYEKHLRSPSCKR